MAPYYEALCKSLDWQVDVDLLSKMKKANEDELKRLDEELEDAEKNLGESEIRDAMMTKAEYLCRIGDKVSAECRCCPRCGARAGAGVGQPPLKKVRKVTAYMLPCTSEPGRRRGKKASGLVAAPHHLPTDRSRCVRCPALSGPRETREQQRFLLVSLLF